MFRTNRSGAGMENSTATAQSSPIFPAPGALPERRPFKVADVDGEQSAWSYCSGDGEDRPFDCVSLAHVVHDVADGDDGVGLGKRIVGQDEDTHVLGACGVLLGELDHRR